MFWKTRHLFTMLGHIVFLQEKMMADFSKLDTDVAAVNARLDELRAKVKDLAAELANPPAAVEDPAIQEHIDSIASALEAAVGAPASA